MPVHLYVVINYPYAGFYSIVMNYQIFTTLQFRGERLVHADEY